MVNSLRGSEWRKWDLHVHTPKSITQEYGGDTDEAWEAYIAALEALPEDIRVLGINDYIFVDGYEKVIEYKNSGRLPNIELILPVIELRINRYTGNEQLRKLNYHVIFSDAVDVSIIKTQFIGALSQNSNLQLNPDSGVQWNEIVNQDSLARLGQLVYDATPAGVTKPSGSMLEIGFNNISFSLEQVQKLLSNNTSLAGQFLTAVGMREWDDFRWDSSPAEKRDLINKVDLIFTASPTSDKANEHIETFKTNNVNHRVIHSSDAHKLVTDATSTQPKELGHCFAWIKADTTFNGLRQVLYDYGDRVKLQPNDPYSDDVKYVLDEINLKEDGILKPHTLPINRDLISIIGSKGSGKSLLLSAISSVSDLGNYDKYKHPIFKSEDADNKQLVDFNLVDKSDDKREKHGIELSEENDDYYTEPILYIAQEELARRSKQPKQVRREYLSELGIDDLSIGYQDITDDTQYNLSQIDTLNSELDRITKSISQDVKSSELVEYLNKKIKNLETTNQKLSNDKTKKVIDELSEIIAKGQNATLWHKDDGFKDINLLAQDMNERVDAFNKKASSFGVTDTSLLPLVNVEELEKAYSKSSSELEAILKTKREEYSTKKEELEKLGVSEDIPTLLKTVENIQRDIATHKKALEETKKVQEDIPKKRDYLSALFKKDAIIHKRISERVEEINGQFTQFKDERKLSPIFEKLFADINVEANIFFDHKQLETDIVECFYKGKLSTTDLHNEIFGEGEATYGQYFKWIENSFWSFLDSHARDLKDRTNSGANGLERLQQAVLLDWYEYVSVSVNITHKFGGDTKEIGSMSTGELATVLLKLILVTLGLDKQIILLDQPEDHLDNEFIANDLVDLIRTLKKMRQVIIVTHNANLVVMTDSEQVIVAKGIHEEYLSGGIENPVIKDNIIKILEGGSEAFEKRYKRYGHS